MNMLEVRLFELRIKGHRLEEIDAEDILTGRAAAQARRLFAHRLGHRLLAWMARRQLATVTPSGTTIS